MLLNIFDGISFFDVPLLQLQVMSVASPVVFYGLLQPNSRWNGTLSVGIIWTKENVAKQSRLSVSSAYVDIVALTHVLHKS